MKKKREFFDVDFFQNDLFLPRARCFIFVLCVLAGIVLPVLGIIEAVQNEDACMFLYYFLYAIGVWVGWVLLNCLFSILYNYIKIRNNLSSIRVSLQKAVAMKSEKEKLASASVSVVSPCDDTLESEEFNGVTYRLKDGVYTVISLNREASAVTVVAALNGVAVRKIGAYAMKDCKNLVSVKLMSSITTIGEGAFMGCESLHTIVLHSGVSSVGENAFAGCSQLTILAEAASRPNGWNENWNPDERPVVWNCKQ